MSGLIGAEKTAGNGKAAEETSPVVVKTETCGRDISGLMC